MANLGPLCTSEKEKASIYCDVLWCSLFRNRGWQESQDHQEPFHPPTLLVVLPPGWDQIRARVRHQDMWATSSRRP